ncbi:5-oxoprolinase subunit C family protein [Thermococcus barophilus]|uniref:Allophanate hydrolase 2 subunit 2 n=1 Tax=Thermococcus barophilus (strain DSM 11836 / MP) TaxID=391623 RepID=F0LMN9_THEBM|nr:biotin-dependent carboxyltransferase family protein [Thermococcus barophilus]ADT84018.1 allophanate hydrolase 2 subunit 2 [Thermococcus barophilus MP]
MIELVNVPSLTTIQDLGRYGYQKFGIPVSGVMDEVSARLANYLVGNHDNASLIEFVLKGPTIRFHSSAVFAVAGDVDVRLNGIPIEPWQSHWAKRGDVLEIGLLKSGVYGYIAFAGGILCDKILGSCSTYLRAKLGKPLKQGDKLKLGYAILAGKEGRVLPEPLIPRYSNESEIRVILGPQLEHFTEKGIETFLSSTYEVTPNSDRMGYRLEGPEIEHSEKGADIITDAIPLGAIQVPANGKPIIMLADRQTTGGYAKIGVVARVDVPKVAQTRAGGKLRFKAINVEEAQELFRKREFLFRSIKRLLDGEVRGYKIKALGKEFMVFVEKEK